MVRAALVVMVLGGCGRIAFDARPTGDGGNDAPDASDIPCATFGPWGSITRITASNAATGFVEWEPALRPDGLVLVFQSNRTEGSGLYVLTRASVTDAFTAPARELTELYGAGVNDGGVSPMWNPDGSELYYVRYQLFGSGPAVAPFVGGDAFGANVPVSLPYPTSDWDISGDLLELFYTDSTMASAELRHATRVSTTDAWIDDGLVDTLNTTGNEGWPSFDEARQEVYFEREGQLHVASRSGRGQPFGTPVLLTDIGTGGDPDISADGLTLVFSDDRSAGAAADLYVATRVCLD